MMLRSAPFPAATRLQFVHADDVADALAQILHRGVTGAFNLAPTPSSTGTGGGRRTPASGRPLTLLRAAAAATWHARLQPTEPGWIDLVPSLPILDSSRAHIDLDWLRPSPPTTCWSTSSKHSGAGRAAPA